MIDGGAEKLEQEFLGYLLIRHCTTPAEFAARFHLSDRSAAYWLGCLVKSGRVRIGRIQHGPADTPANPHAGRDAPTQEEDDDSLQAVLEVSAAFSPFERVTHEGRN
jgi:hypothetical protein